jgi:hypothetical protein
MPAWQLTATNPVDTMLACNQAARAGYQVTAMPPVGGAGSWTVNLVKAATNEQISAVEYQWLVYDGSKMVAYSNDQFIVLYTSHVPLVWAADPAASAQPGLAASITFSQPTSANGPWTYTVEQTDTTTNTTSQAVLSGAPVVNNDEVTLAVTGLTAGHGYTFTVTVDTQYSGVSASAVSNSVTASALPWEATSTAPVAKALAGLQASVVFPEPAGSGAVFAVVQDDLTAQSSGAAAIASQAVANGEVTLIVAGLTLGHSYTFTVSATEGSNTATALVSNQVIATT